MKDTYKWNSIANGKFPVSDEKVLLNTTTYGTVIGYYDIEDEAFFILSGAESRILHNEVIAWAEIPECDIEKPDTKFRLPSKEDFEKLDKCYTRFDNGLKGRWFYDEDTGEKLFLPCDGYRRCYMAYDVSVEGCYWSSTYCSDIGAYCFGFNIRNMFSVVGSRDNGYSVRLVSDEPFEGAIHMAGLYWKSTNEDGYFTYDEVMEKFNK